jgi:hypothetical protein
MGKSKIKLFKMPLNFLIGDTLSNSSDPENKFLESAKM